MPQTSYINNYGKEEPITIEACSRAARHFYHCLDSKGNLQTIHRSCVITRYSQEEILHMKKKELEKEYEKIQQG